MLRRESGVSTRPAGHRSWSRPAARAAICFPPRRWPSELAERGIPVHLATDRRAARYSGALRRRRRPCRRQRDAARSRSDRRAANRSGLGIGLVQGWSLIGRLKPAAVIGFGGYPSVPAMLAAAWRGVPTMITSQCGGWPRQPFDGAARDRDRHDVSRCLPRRADTRRQGDADRQSGAARGRGRGGAPYPALGAIAAPPGVRRQPGRARLGRCRARRAIGLLEPDLRARLAIVQQARAEDLERVRAAYANCRLRPKSRPFFPTCRRAWPPAIW